MPDPVTLHHALPVVVAFCVLLTAGVAALIHFATQRHPTPLAWPRRIHRLALQTSWDLSDFGKLLVLFAIGQIARIALPPTAIWSMVTFHGILLVGILRLARRKKHPFGLPLRWPQVAVQATLRWLAILPILWFTSGLWQLALKALGQSTDLQLSIRLLLETTGLLPRITFLAFAVFLAPIVEEVLFRGILLPLLARRIGPVPATVLSSIGFAAIHADLGSFAPLTLLAIALSLAYARTRSLRVPIAMHMLFNAANLLLLFALMRAHLV